MEQDKEQALAVPRSVEPEASPPDRYLSFPVHHETDIGR